jgi:hypothetical protein
MHHVVVAGAMPVASAEAKPAAMPAVAMPARSQFAVAGAFKVFSKHKNSFISHA